MAITLVTFTKVSGGRVAVQPAHVACIHAASEQDGQPTTLIETTYIDESSGIRVFGSFDEVNKALSA